MAARKDGAFRGSFARRRRRWESVVVIFSRLIPRGFLFRSRVAVISYFSIHAMVGGWLPIVVAWGAGGSRRERGEGESCPEKESSSGDASEIIIGSSAKESYAKGHWG